MLTGCVQTTELCHVNEATVRVLSLKAVLSTHPQRRHARRSFVASGHIDDAAASLDNNIEVFEASGAEAVAVNAAGCGSAMKDTARMFADDPVWAARAHAFSDKVRDVSQCSPSSALHARRVTRSPRAWCITMPATWPTGRGFGRSHARCCKPFPAWRW